MNLYALARPLLFRLDPERAHDVAFRALDWLAPRSTVLGLISGPAVLDPIELLGLRFPNRVGLAAGLDKNARHVAALTQLGFGFLEVGTVTPRAQPGKIRRTVRREVARGSTWVFEQTQGVLEARGLQRGCVPRSTALGATAG